MWAEVADLYDAERLTKVLPKMASSANTSELRQAFEQHLSQTEGHVRRLEQIFSSHNHKRDGATCEAMRGLIQEGDEMASAKGDHDVRDAALIAAAPRRRALRNLGLWSARVFAHRLGYDESARLLQETLDEGKEADQKLNVIAERSLNVRAERA